MKQNRKLPGLLSRALANDPHGDTVALQMNPQEAQIVSGLLTRMGGAGVRNPRIGTLQYYPAGAEGGGSNPGGDRNGYGGRDGTGAGTGNGGGGSHAGTPSSEDLRSWAPGTTDVPGNQTQVQRGKYDPDNIGRHETYGYYGQAPTPTQNFMSHLGSFLGIGYHPNAINVGVPGYNETQSRISLDPVGMALSAAGMFSPLGQMASLGYKGLSMAGYGAPQIGFNSGGTLAGPSSPQSTTPGVNQGANGDPQIAANITNQQQQDALKASQGPVSAPSNAAALGLLGQAQAGAYTPIWGNYGATTPNYGYLAWR